MKKKRTPLAEKAEKHSRSPDFTDPDTDSDKTADDDDADDTVKKENSGKSKLEINPDSTGRDTQADKTKKEKFPEQK